ncbi:MAG: transporter [Pseudomonadota bacterium]|nr:transporter [Pseudomonadota bacterium]
MGAISPAASTALTGLAAFAPVVRESLPLISGAANIFSGVQNLVNSPDEQEDNYIEQQRLELRQLQERQNAQLKAQQQETALSREKLAAEAKNAEENRLSALRRAVARQRASFGATGLSANEGSAEAVLLGLFEETDQDRQQRERLDTLRNRALDNDLASTQSLNVLQRSQLAQQQRLERIAKGY